MCRYAICCSESHLRRFSCLQSSRVGWLWVWRRAFHFLLKCIDLMKNTLNFCRSFQFGKEKYLTPWVLIIGRKQVPMLEVTLVSFLMLNLPMIASWISLFSLYTIAVFVFYLHILHPHIHLCDWMILMTFWKLTPFCNMSAETFGGRLRRSDSQSCTYAWEVWVFTGIREASIWACWCWSFRRVFLILLNSHLQHLSNSV